MPGSLDLTLARDFTGAFSVDAFQADGVTPQSLVGMVLHFRSSGPASIDKNSNAGGITITNTAGGSACALLQIEPADTLGVPDTEDGYYRMRCQLTLVDGAEEYLLADGDITITPRVTP